MTNPQKTVFLIKKSCIYAKKSEKKVMITFFKVYIYILSDDDIVLVTYSFIFRCSAVISCIGRLQYTSPGH